MPNNTNSVTFRCTVKRMFRNCPKPDGWFGCFIHMRGRQDDAKLTGKTTLHITDGMSLDITAEQIDDDNYIATDIQIVTKTTKGLTAYLKSLPGVSEAVATKLVRYVGVNVLDTLKQGEDAIRRMSTAYNLGLTKPQIDSLAKGISAIGQQNQLLQFLPELASSPKLIKRIESYLDNPINDIKNNPYILLTIPGFTFPVVDAIAIRLGIGVISLERFGHAMHHIMKIDASGDMYVNLSSDIELTRLMHQLEKLLNVQFSGMNDFGKWVIKIVDTPKFRLYIDTYTNNGVTERHLYLQDTFRAMGTITDKIRMSQYNPPYKRLANMSEKQAIAEAKDCIYDYELKKSTAMKRTIQLVPEQIDAILTAMTHNISIITGGPGRGKTMMIECLAYCWRSVYQGKILLLAPTGKAMNKLQMATGRVYDTKTIDSIILTEQHAEQHAALRDNTTNNKGYPSWNHSNMLVIIDESSMIDVQKAADMFALLDRCRFCFVGDADQLPPIAKGTFFKDLISASIAIPYIPVTRLVTPLRNSGVILSNSDKVNNNDTSLVYNLTDFPFFPQNDDDNDALSAIIDTYVEEKQNTPNITDMVLLCPMRKGAIGTDSINIAIQNINCPENKIPHGSFDQRRARENFVNRGYPIPDTIFGNANNYTKLRVGDIVINTVNNYGVTGYIYENNDYFNGKATDKRDGLFNGDCGKIIAYIPPVDPTSKGDGSHSYMVIQLFDGRIVELDITIGEADYIELGYALTVHKAQGCEYNTVIYVSPKRLLNLPMNGFACKNLVYTAFTRAKNKVAVIGSKDSLNLCIKSNIPARNSNLRDRMMNCGTGSGTTHP